MRLARSPCGLHVRAGAQRAGWFFGVEVVLHGDAGMGLDGRGWPRPAGGPSNRRRPARTAPYRSAAALSAATILLVEVEPLLTDSIKYTLERDGHRIVTAATRQAGLAAMALERPALVLVELDQSPSEVA